MKSVFEGRLRIDFKAILKTLFIISFLILQLEKENLAILRFSESKNLLWNYFKLS